MSRERTVARTNFRVALGTCLLAWLTTVGATCGDTGQTHVTAEVVGHGVGDTTFESAGWSVTLTRADVAFGPAYFCATTAADVDLCPAAVAETLDVGVVDGLSADLQPLGILEGDTQTVRSATYDFGITWLATEPAPLPAREAPGGHSARFLGTAVRGADSFDFALDLDITSANQGDIAIRGARTEHELSTRTERLEVTVDVVAWWAGVDFDALFADAAAAPGERLVIDPNGLNAGVVRTGMTSRALPEFTWIDN